MIARRLIPRRPLPRFSTASRRASRRFESNKAPSEQTPPSSPPQQQKSSYAQGLSGFRALQRPFAKVFLGAMFTYQVLYWSWEKIRTQEIVEQRSSEVQQLEKQVEAYKNRKAGQKP